MKERRQHEDDKGRRRDDRVLRVLRSIDKSLKTLVAALPRKPGKLKRQAMIFGAVKSKN
jgi:hypothetical protein